MTEAANPGTLDPAAPIEEETVKGYKAEHYHPVSIGEVLGGRTQVIGKLGYGSASAVWLCRDSQRDVKYVALKVYINSSKVLRELAIYEHINGLDSQHHGRARIRKLLDSFVIDGPHGRHLCLVHEALGMNLEELRDLVPGEVFDAGLIRHCLRDVLRGIDFFTQRSANHIQPKNILLGVLDHSAFARFERDEKDAPFPRKELPSRTVYISRPMPLTKGEPSLCNLSEARFGSALNTDLVMPSVYRAPEVVLGMPWSYPIDVWAFAMTLWDLFEPRRLFSPIGEVGQYSEQHHLAQMAAILGPPPRHFLDRSEKCRKLWNEDGRWRGEVPIPEITLEIAEQRLDGTEKALFLTFMRKMLQWAPEDRGDPRDVFMDERLLADLIESGEVVREP